MDFKNIFNKGKDYALKVKDNIGKSIEEQNRKKALIEEQISKATTFSIKSFEPILSQNKENLDFYMFLIKELKVENQENIKLMLPVLASKNEVILMISNLIDKKDNTSYIVIFTDKFFYLAKETSYICLEYNLMSSLQILDKGPFNAIITFSNYVVAIKSNSVDGLVLLLQEDKRNELKETLKQKYVDYKEQQKNINTALGITKYIMDNELTKGKNNDWILNNAQIIEKRLLNDETIILPFVGYLNYVSETDPGDAFVFVLTNHRLLFANNGLLGESFNAIPRLDITGITLNNTALNGVINIHTKTKQIIVGVDASKSLVISKNLQGINNKEETKDESSIATEILKLKQLLDAGVINEEDFERGKAKLLG